MFVAHFLQPLLYSIPLVLGRHHFVADGVLALISYNVRQRSHADKLRAFHNCAGKVVHGGRIIGVVQTHAVKDSIGIPVACLVKDCRGTAILCYPLTLPAAGQVLPDYILAKDHSHAVTVNNPHCLQCQL